MINIHLIALLVLGINLKPVVQSQRSAIALLAREVEPQVMSFAQSLTKDASNYSIDVYIVIDNKKASITYIHNNSAVRILDVSTFDCWKYGYQYMITIDQPHTTVTSWDKAFFYFNVLNRNHSFLWIIEDDVFIPTNRAFLAVHSLYSDNSDILIAGNSVNRLGISSHWHWNKAVGLFVPPWSNSMANAVGLSRRALDKVDEYVRWRGQAAYHEFFFNTLAIHENLTLRSPLTMDTLVWRHHHTYEQLVKKPNNFWHPMKDLRHDSWRQRLLNEASLKWEPVNFIDLLSLCHHQHDQNANAEEKHLESVVQRFDQMKSFYRRHQRLSIHRNAINAIQRCQNQNTSVAILSLLLRLANHAFRQPEVLDKELVQEKSVEHRRLEEALRQNKETVLALVSKNLSHGLVVKKLREHAIDLTILLTKEIQREAEQEERRMNETRVRSSTPTPEQMLVNRFIVETKTADAVSSRSTTDERDLSNLVTIEWMELSMVLFAFIVFILVRRWKRQTNSEIARATLS